MFGRLFLLFLVVPILDLALLIAVGGRIGFWPTFGIAVASALLGSWLARREGVAAWQRVQRKMTAGGVPGPELIDGLLILIAGTLLITPGFLTDLVGLLGLFPPTRAVLRRTLRRRFEAAVQQGAVRVVSGSFGSASFGGGAGAPPFGPHAAPPFGPHIGRGGPGIEDAEVIDDGAPPQGQ
ncbi:FxsA family protein [Rubrivirga sp. S365]|uniref:FxsA family protein n=1 Tax=Rubrivirga litoralis TaxID=3075598 RepID=A0ABU3BT52_9BACT|nr:MULTISPECIES: FxsA family protein [unclassified Rubrivirga]MDT0632473.1 FxsA family protein [Rubrivirga sp. F394]MDT7857973.1 FxsA family protein [Rubrivirga sp. S365]